MKRRTKGATWGVFRTASLILTRGPNATQRRTLGYERPQSAGAGLVRSGCKAGRARTRYRWINIPRTPFPFFAMMERTSTPQA